MRRRSRGAPAEIWIDSRDGSGVRRRIKIGPNTPENLLKAKQLVAEHQVQALKSLQPAAVPALNAPVTVPVRTKGPTFRDIGENWWKMLGAQKSHSWRTMLNQLYAHFGPMPAADVTTKLLQEHYNWKMTQSSPSTANRHLSLIKTVYNRAIEWGDFDSVNPANRVRHKPENPSRLRFLSQQEIDTFLTICQRPGLIRVYPFIVCAIFTGMRRGEIEALDWSNINIEQGIIYVLHTKSGKPRQVPVASKFREVLVSMGPKTAGLVFDAASVNFRKLFDEARAAAGFPYFRFHDLRHTFASHFLMRVGDITALQRILGHSDPKMTQRYAHLSQGHIRAAMDKFDAGMPVLRGVPPVIIPQIVQSGLVYPDNPHPI